MRHDTVLDDRVFHGKTDIQISCLFWDMAMAIGTRKGFTVLNEIKVTIVKYLGLYIVLVHSN
jgi:hypothetical protein